MDRLAEIAIHDKAGKVLETIMEELDKGGQNNVQ